MIGAFGPGPSLLRIYKHLITRKAKSIGGPLISQIIMPFKYETLIIDGRQSN